MTSSLFATLRRSVAWPLGLSGVALLLLGLLMWVVPELAAVLVSGVLFLMGGALLFLAWRARRLPIPHYAVRVRSRRPHPQF